MAKTNYEHFYGDPAEAAKTIAATHTDGPADAHACFAAWMVARSCVHEDTYETDTKVLWQLFLDEPYRTLKQQRVRMHEALRKHRQRRGGNDG